MKKIIALILVLTLIFSLTACGKPVDPTPATTAPTTAPTPKPLEPTTVRIGGLTGPTTIGMINMLEGNSSGGNNIYEPTIAGSADELTPKFIKGELDVMAVPANLAAILSTKTDLQILAINTLGVTNIMAQGDSIKSMVDLKGKTILATGKGSIPEYTLRYMLKANGVDPDKDVTIEWKTQPTEVVAILKNDKNAIAMLPQPFATAATAQVEGLKIAIDLNDTWDALDTDSKYITGVLIARTDFIEKNSNAIQMLMDNYMQSTEFVLKDIDSASKLVAEYKLAPSEAVAKLALPKCNIVCITGEEMKTALSGYYKVLYDEEAKSVGGKLPSEEIYFS